MAGLNHTSTSYYDQWKNLDQLFANNAGAVGAMPAFAARVGLWTGSMSLANGLATKANASLKGFTKTKNTAKKTASKTASVQAGKGASYAITKKNTTLEDQMTKLTLNFLNKETNDPDLAGVIEGISTTLSPFIISDPIVSADYFTAVSLGAMGTDKITYTGKLGLYRNAFAVVGGAKIDFVAVQHPIMEEHIKFMEGFLDDLYTGYPDFVNAFRAIVKKLDDIGKRNQGVDANITKEGSGDPFGLGALLQITNYPPVKKAKIKSTNSMGVITLLKLKVGTWTVKITAPGYITQTVTIIVKAKKTVTLNIVMVVAPPPPVI
jgi:hypothetical protein